MGHKFLLVAVFTALTYASTASAYDIRHFLTDQFDKVRLFTRGL
ncbi:MAG TPA: hypothetical protein VJ890_20900 [Vineibacter sp.]|nr:hypothetical protein [Vineibacter sp.]